MAVNPFSIPGIENGMTTGHGRNPFLNQNRNDNGGGGGGQGGGNQPRVIPPQFR